MSTQPQTATAEAPGTPESLAVLPAQVRIDIAEHLLGGRLPNQIARELDIDPAEVTAAVAEFGAVGRWDRKRLTLEQHFRSRTRHLYGGHLLWLDRVDCGIPVLHHGGRMYSALHVAWRMANPGQHDPEPAARPVPACDMPLCVALDHALDRTTHQQLATLVIELFGDTRP
ncbi:hypothetical protein ACFRDV_22345 [Streptomyces fagopyri]|uniref:hypothetical protein n=1 Tax=Streptomyces fagopyri TaxID=2662397 RepID=UPI00369CF59A